MSSICDMRDLYSHFTITTRDQEIDSFLCSSGMTIYAAGVCKTDSMLLCITRRYCLAINRNISKCIHDVAILRFYYGISCVCGVLNGLECLI